jgi:hypothetical protein
MIRRCVTSIVSWFLLAAPTIDTTSSPEVRTASDEASSDRWSPSARHSAQYRQGDLLFVYRPVLPGRLLPGRLTARADGVIERGELTGHAHRLVGGVVYDTWDHHVCLVVGPDARVVHEKHDALELPEGGYVVVRQREYHGEEETRDVRD